MCRLFLLLQNQDVPKKKTTSLLETFLAQSIHAKKNTPGLQNPRDLHQHYDGYGFAYTSSTSNHNTKWTIYKKPHISKEDPNIDRVMETVTESPVILGHIRSASKGMAVAYENTHPFHYKNQVFMHNGQIHGFTPSVRKALMSHILPKFRPLIKGTTDSEVLFYLFLTCLGKIELFKDSANSLIEAFQRTVSILKNAGINEFAGNIVFANKTHILVTRYLLHDSFSASANATTNFPKKQTPNSLYISDIDGHICISSEPVSKKRATLIPENMAMVFSIGKDHVFEKIIELSNIY